MIADGFSPDSCLGRRCRAMEGDWLGVGTTTAWTMVMATTDGSFLDPLTVLVVTDYVIGGGAAGVLFH